MILFASDSDADQDSVTDPTPDQIRRRAAAIRQRWSEGQRKRRHVASFSAWLLPVVHVADVTANDSQFSSSG
ncbi:hypothetical protein [Rubripirellula tenax]|nr:hypothetical protein [Rubripirellula tenax]